HAHFVTTESLQHAAATSYPSLPTNDGKLHLLLAGTGSVAAIKIPLIVEKLLRTYGRHRIAIQVLATDSAMRFIEAAEHPLPADVRIWRDADEWREWSNRNDPIVHIELRRWAHAMLIAPLSANTLAKIANGLCDNLVTAVVRAWNTAMPIFLAPAMNTYMYTNPITKKHLNVIKNDMDWITILRPVEKVLACGDIGMGGMREWSDIVEIIATKFPPSCY
ncbi:flavoprotein, partial [Dipodascopsis tothii]|uniref:flavoprotein n=1 Tax=Dipodascopsis tothii TaxID=44089 RepID=UPI0034CECEC6